DAFEGPTWRRFLAAQLLVDESWAIAQRDGRTDGLMAVGAGLVLYAAWSIGTVVGVIGGGVIGRPEKFGLDAAFPAMFVVLLAPQLSRGRARLAAAGGAAIALAFTPV